MFRPDSGPIIFLKSGSDLNLETGSGSGSATLVIGALVSASQVQVGARTNIICDITRGVQLCPARGGGGWRARLFVRFRPPPASTSNRPSGTFFSFLQLLNRTKTKIKILPWENEKIAHL